MFDIHFPTHPIGGGLFILLGLGAAYGGKKLYDLRKSGLLEKAKNDVPYLILDD